MDVRRAIAPALALWLSGVCCLLMCAAVCGEPGAGAASARDCCARSAEIEAEEAACSGPAIGGPATHAAGTCCFLSTRAAAHVPRPDTSAAPLASPDARVSTVVPTPVEPPAPPRATVLATSRGDTPLRCCVFLI